MCGRLCGFVCEVLLTPRGQSWGRGEPGVRRTRGPGQRPRLSPLSRPVLQGHVYRFCTADGLWLHQVNSSLPWRDLSECEESKRGDRVS